MCETVPVTEALFDLFLAGCGGRHIFVPHEEITDEHLDAKVHAAEREYGFSAWQRNAVIITTPATQEGIEKFRAVARRAGYRAYISNEESRCGPAMIEFCEITLVRFDVRASMVG